MDHQNSLRPTNPLTSFLWGVLAYSLSYLMVKMAAIEVRSNGSSGMGMPSLDFSWIIEIILILTLTYILLMIFLRPSVAWVTFALAGFIGVLTSMAALFFIISFLLVSIPNAASTWLENYPILIALILATPAYLAFAAMFARVVFDKQAIPLFLKLFGIASLALSLVGTLVLERPMIKAFLITLLPELESTPPTMMLLLLMVAPLSAAGMALYHRRPGPGT